MDAKLALSTATPSIGGTAPKLDTAKLMLIPNVYPQRTQSSFMRKERHAKGRAYGFGEVAQQIESAQARVSEGLSSSVFEISALATIPCDNSGHKVH